MPDFDESPYTPDELAMLRTGEVTEIPAGQEHEPLAMIYRKAKAFTFLSGLRYFDVMNDDWVTMHRFDDSVSSDGATLLDCVEMAMREHKEPTDA